MNLKYEIGQSVEVEHNETIQSTITKRDNAIINSVTIGKDGIAKYLTSKGAFTESMLDAFVKPEPVAAPVEDKPKFKVGDKIVGIGSCDGIDLSKKFGTIRKLYDGCNYATVEFDEDVGGWCNDNPKILFGHGWNVNFDKMEPYSAPSEPSQPKLIVTRQMLVELHACSGERSGLEAFDKYFASGTGEFEEVKAKCVDINRGDFAYWLDARKSQIVAMQSEQKKETVKLYCHKSHYAGKWLTKGITYAFGADGYFVYDSGKSYGKYASVADYLKHNVDMAACLCEAVKRPIVAGEYALITDGSGSPRAHKGDVLKCIGRWSGGAIFEVPDDEDTSLYDIRYLVLDGYTPEEPKEEYLNMRVVCVANSYELSSPVSKFIIGKPYEVENGHITSETGFVSDHYKTVTKLCEGMGHTFIEFKGSL